MRIRITKGSGWYEDKVGEVFEVDEPSSFDGEDIFFVDGLDAFEINGNRRYVHADHAEIYFEDKAEYDPHTAVQTDAVNSPSHYTAGDIEVIDIIAQTVAGYKDPFVAHNVGTATKYLNRAPYKHESPLQDLEKARAYLTFAIEHLTKIENAKGSD